MTAEIQRPLTEPDLARMVASAAKARTPIEIMGGGTKRDIGRPMQTASALTTRALRGVTLYEPNELVLAARAGTSLAEVKMMLNARNQELAFEPLDLGPLLGYEPDSGTIGAVFATNLSGPRRIQVGAARDHLLGIRAVNGRGEVFKNGGRVMKNVTGYDLVKAMSGSWGTLGILTEVTMKVLPRAQESRTVLIPGLNPALGIEALCRAMGTPYEVSGAAHFEAPIAARLPDILGSHAAGAVTAMRIETFSQFAPGRTEALMTALSAFGAMSVLEHPQSVALWEAVRTLSPFTHTTDPMWRITVAPDRAARVVERIRERVKARALFDWSGGLIWLELDETADANASLVQRTVAGEGGQASLIRAAPDVRAMVDVFQPLNAGTGRLTRAVKSAFDPDGILNPGRMYAGI